MSSASSAMNSSRRAEFENGDFRGAVPARRTRAEAGAAGDEEPGVAVGEETGQMGVVEVRHRGEVAARQPDLPAVRVAGEHQVGALQWRPEDHLGIVDEEKERDARN